MSLGPGNGPKIFQNFYLGSPTTSVFKIPGLEQIGRDPGSGVGGNGIVVRDWAGLYKITKIAINSLEITTKT